MQLGLSVTTVARSLKDGHKISPETVQRVRDTADALGYVRNLDGLRLRTGQSLTIAALLGADDRGEDPLRSALFSGMHCSLSRTDYALRSLPAEDRALQPILSAMRSNRADGFVLDRLVPDDERVSLLLDHDFPFVTFGAPASGCSHPFLRLDEGSAARGLTLAHLGEGRRKIVHVDGDTSLIDVDARRGGYLAALGDAGLPPVPALAPTGLAERVAHLVADGTADAFVIGADALLPAVLDGLARAGTRSGDIGLGLRTARSVPHLLPFPMHLAWYPGEEAGRILANLLVARLGGEAPEDLQRDEAVELLPA